MKELLKGSVALRKGPVHLAWQIVYPPVCELQFQPAASTTKLLKIPTLKAYQRLAENGPGKLRFKKQSRSCLLISENVCFILSIEEIYRLQELAGYVESKVPWGDIQIIPLLCPSDLHGFQRQMVLRVQKMLCSEMLPLLLESSLLLNIHPSFPCRLPVVHRWLRPSMRRINIQDVKKGQQTLITGDELQE